MSAVRHAEPHHGEGREPRTRAPASVDREGRRTIAKQSEKQSLAVEPIDGLAPWLGGKRNLAKRLVSRIERIDHRTYAEPFVGMGGVFFRRTRRVRNEVINDLSGDVVNLFRIAKHHPNAFLEELKLTLPSRSEFQRLLALPRETLTDVQRAARFYWIQKNAYGGRIRFPSFAASPYTARGPSSAKLRAHYMAAWRRLQRVTIENLPYAEFMQRYDKPSTLFYLDPPYWGRETWYGKGLFERADFERLADQLRRIKGRFILSMNDLPEVRQTFKGFSISRVEFKYSVAHSRGRELIITGGGS